MIFYVVNLFFFFVKSDSCLPVQPVSSDCFLLLRWITEKLRVKTEQRQKGWCCDRKIEGSGNQSDDKLQFSNALTSEVPMSNTVGVKDPLHGRVSSSFSQRAAGLLISEGTGYITRIQSNTMISIQERCSWIISVLRLSIGVLLQFYLLRRTVFWWNHTLNYESVPSVLLDGLFVSLSHHSVSDSADWTEIGDETRGQRCIIQLCRGTISCNGRAAVVCPCVWWHLGDDV